jgi:serine/threonine protein kinase
MSLFDIFRGQKLKPEGASPRAGKQRQAVAATSEDWYVGQTLLDDFVVERVLGEGGMGKVYLVKSRTTGMRFAVKRAKGLSVRNLKRGASSEAATREHHGRQEMDTVYRARRSANLKTCKQ